MKKRYKMVRHQKILSLVNNFIEPSIMKIKRARKIKTTPHKDIEKLLNIFFPKTKYMSSHHGFFKHVFIIHSDKRFIVLKEGKSKDIRKDYNTYQKIPKNVRNRYFAKIYWRSSGGKFMLQKYGKNKKVPEKEEERLKQIGKKYWLKDIREANIMFVDNKFKIIDAERIKRKKKH